MKKLFSLLLALLGFTAQAQVTFRITAVPANTPATATLYMAGTFNNWNPASPAHALTYNAATASYDITLPTGTGTIGYKFTRGSWATVETNASNGQVPNRSFTFGSSPGPVLHQVLNWEDLAGGTPGGQSTANANVSVISTTFQMPQLNRSRRVWIYLPTGYAAGTRSYPVLYMQDGQNVFDNLTAFAGEWGVDEALAQLQASGQDPTGCIVVAIDNGGAARLDEYSPWNNPQYGGGQGEQYVNFLVQTLKPYIDQNYRTLAGREHTGIAGSSMGGLIATYAALRYPAVFSKVGVFSPAFWFANAQLHSYLRQHPANPDTRFYFVAGATESATMVPNMQAVRDSLARSGVPAANLSFLTHADGQHAEWYWRREFPAAYQWLYAAAVPTTTARPQPLAAQLYPSPTAETLRVQLPATTATAELRLTDTLGREVLRRLVRPDATVDVRGLPKGLYLYRLSSAGANGTGKFVKE